MRTSIGEVLSIGSFEADIRQIEMATTIAELVTALNDLERNDLIAECGLRLSAHVVVAEDQGMAITFEELKTQLGEMLRYFIGTLVNPEETANHIRKISKDAPDVSADDTLVRLYYKTRKPFLYIPQENGLSRDLVNRYSDGEHKSRMHTQTNDYIEKIALAFETPESQTVTFANVQKFISDLQAGESEVTIIHPDILTAIRIISQRKRVYERESNIEESDERTMLIPNIRFEVIMGPNSSIPFVLYVGGPHSGSEEGLPSVGISSKFFENIPEDNAGLMIVRSL